MMKYKAAIQILFFVFTIADIQAQLGSNWTEYFPDFDYHVPPNADGYGERYTYEDGVFHLWVKDTDLSTFPGQDSGPRSEVRVRNEYTEGYTQFQADFKVGSGADKVGIWQVFQSPYPWMIRVYTNGFFVNGSSFSSVDWDQWHQLNIIHNTNNNKVQVFFDGTLVLDTYTAQSNGSVDWYNKFGVYGREGMGELNEIWYRDVRFFRSDNPGPPGENNNPDPEPEPEPEPDEPLTGTDTTLMIPGLIEAELYSSMLGIDTETTADPEGGNLNVGWINTGDWLEYQIDVEQSGNFEFVFRTATNKDGVSIDLNLNQSVVASASVPNSGDWQTWETTSIITELSEGTHTLRLEFDGGDNGDLNLLNLNWIDVKSTDSGSTNLITQDPQAIKQPNQGHNYDALGRIQPSYINIKQRKALYKKHSEYGD